MTGKLTAQYASM